MEANGAFINVKSMDDAEKYLLKEIKSAEAALQKWGDINWSSPKQISHLLYEQLHIKCPVLTDKGAKSTAESALNQIDHACVADLKRLRAVKQEHSFFIKGWRPFIVNERLHPNIKLHGTVTGRASYEHPNLQQTTREPRIRSLITAPVGWELLEADLSQIELRIIGHLSQDPTMMQTFREGRDIHWRTALREVERAAGYPELVLSTASTLTQKKITSYAEGMKIVFDAGPSACKEIDKQWDNFRYNAKAVNFGYCVKKGTKVSVPNGTKKIEDIRPGDLVYSYNDKLELCLSPVITIGYTGIKQCYRVHWQGGRGNSGYLDVTTDHGIRLVDGSYIRVDQLKKGDRVLALHRITTNKRNFLRVTGQKGQQQESRFIFKQINGYLPQNVHHDDRNSLNDSPKNLIGITSADHTKLHSPQRKRHDLTEHRVRKALASGGIMKAVKQLRCDYSTLQERMRRYKITGYGYNNHWITSVTKIGQHPTYDIEVKGTSNFIANELCVHNSFRHVVAQV